MEIVQQTDITQGADVMTGMPVIDSEEELKKYLGEPEPAKPVQKKDEPKPENKKSTPFAAPGDAAEEGEEDENNGAEGEDKKEGEEEGEDNVPEYPTLLHYLNDTHKLDLNLEGITQLSKEEEAEAIGGLIERMTEGVNAALEEYRYLDTLIQDPEIQSVLRAKQEGKTLRDLFAEFGTSMESLSDEQLAIKDFKKRFPKSPDEAIQGMIESLKKGGQFESFVSGLREQHKEEQSLESERAKEAAKQKAEQDAIREREEIGRYANYVSQIPAVYGVPLTEEMKQNVFQMTTVRDKDGLTALDHALQSDEGTVLAALGVMYMHELIRNGASLQKNRSKARTMDRIFDSADKLQSGGGRQTQGDDPYAPDVLNRF